MDLPDGISEEDLPQLHDGQYPPNAVTAEERLRFRLSVGIAQKLFEEADGPNVWMAARSIYNNPDMPTN